MQWKRFYALLKKIKKTVQHYKDREMRMSKGDLTNGDCMLPVKTDKDIIRYLREALRIQEHNTHSMADKYCKIYKMYKAYRTRKRHEKN